MMKQVEDHMDIKLKKTIKGVRVHNLSLVLMWHRLRKIDFKFPG